MAMLAEPRRRKRYNLCPRGKALYEDDTRFGTKMLEKMGWSKGRGLGAKEDGSQEFVRVRFKNDAEGLGYEMRDDQWTEHEEGFNGLLKALNRGDTNAKNETADNDNASASEEETRPMGFGFKSAAAAPAEEVKPQTLKEKISGISLEEKSKYSKARVHYKKFTRGKDLAQYSEKDLANIFGKKVNEENAAPFADIPPEEAEEETKSVDPNFAGVQTVSTGQSVNDYFREKMEAMKNRLSNIASSKITETNSFLNGAEAQTETATVNGVDEEGNETTKKKKKNKAKKKKQEEAEIELPEETLTDKKKKKKAKRAAEEDVMESEVIAIEEEETNPPKRKKKKDRKESEEVEAIPEVTEGETKKRKVVETAAETPEETKPPKKKSKKSKKDDKEEQTLEPEPIEETTSKTKKKSKKLVEPSIEVEPDEQQTIATESAELTEMKTKKKKKKSKQNKELAAEEAPELTEAASKTKKKSRKTAEEPVEVLDLTQEDQPTTTIITEPALIAIKSKNKKESKKHKSKVSADDQVVGSGDKSDSKAEAKAVAPNYLSMVQLKKKLDSFNEFPISSFCAEKFHILNMNAYKNSTLAQITGYMFDENIKLKIVELKTDAKRIMDLWDGKRSKYSKNTKAFKKRYRRLNTADIKRLSRIKAFTGI